MIDFVHPGELSAWKTLSDNKAFQYVADVFQSIYTDLTAFAAIKGRNFLVTEKTMPGIYSLYRTAADRLGIADLPPLYLEQEYALSIRTVGTDGDCAVVLSSACLEDCSDEQLLALFGQELAHVRCRHLRMLNIDPMLDALLTKVPMVGPVAAQTLKTLLLQWKEYACYTADRGAAIAAGSKEPVFQNLTHAMGLRLDTAGTEAILADAEDCPVLPSEQSAAAKMILQIMLSGINVPFGIWRLRELNAWEGSIRTYTADGDGAPVRIEMDPLSKKTVETIDLAAKGLYQGAVKTAETVKTGAEQINTYVAENSPVWKENIRQAGEKTAEAVKTGKENLDAYVAENSPIWKENLRQAGEKTAEAVKTGKENLDAYVAENSPIWKYNLEQAGEKTAAAVRSGQQKLSSFLKEKAAARKDAWDQANRLPEPGTPEADILEDHPDRIEPTQSYPSLLAMLKESRKRK